MRYDGCIEGKIFDDGGYTGCSPRSSKPHSAKTSGAFYYGLPYLNSNELQGLYATS